MAQRQRRPSGERAKTDDSLRAERENTDDALKKDRVSSERSADSVVDQARSIADNVLSEARATADDELLSAPPSSAETRARESERAEADSAVRAERDRADVLLRDDRQDQADLLGALLVHERASTDAHLVTERARSDDAVSHRDDFLGMVAHDVRNLLNLVVLSLESLRQGDVEPLPHVAAAVNRIRRYTARMNRLIGDLVDVTSIDAGKLAVQAIESDAAALVAEATETFQTAVCEKGLSLAVEIPAGPLLAVFDHDRILQVFANLLSNAIKFTPGGGNITVRVEATPGMLRFCISDTGVGIPETMLEAIFERFWQVGENDRRGMGLGLYISKCIVEAHRGRIWAESVPGSGSQLCFTLPVPTSETSEGERRPTSTPA